MPKSIKRIDIYQCEKCVERGSWDDIKKHEEDVCFADIKECDYSIKYNTKNLQAQYSRYQHEHKDFREILKCNEKLLRLTKNFEVFGKLLKCSKNHKIIMIDTDITSDEYYYSDITLHCENECNPIQIDLDDLQISEGYIVNNFRLFQEDILGTDLNNYTT